MASFALIDEILSNFLCNLHSVDEAGEPLQFPFGAGIQMNRSGRNLW